MAASAMSSMVALDVFVSAAWSSWPSRARSCCEVGVVCAGVVGGGVRAPGLREGFFEQFAEG